MSSNEKILVLIGNLSNTPIKVKKNQLLDHLQLEENSSLADVIPFEEFGEFKLPCNSPVALLNTCVATEFPEFPVNVTYNAQGVLNESPLDVSNGMNQSDGNVELRSLSPN
ncbi:hypothetical protein DSO57_1009195 [Entomophthora muscae]|uniref:Uncharacterized protein n=1 Tax=Entomophthora muscae TaxID=34485 RepID=A0ACC2U599_9FUNG|nr:hypothetical protein DSO57_1009195 [Entomophthora muscae]